MSNQETLNNITGNFYSDEWYTDQKTVDICLEILAPVENSTVMCPYDSIRSLFVQTLWSHGHKVIYEIEDFLLKTHEYDYLVTNPPFSIKDKVIERVYQSGKKAVLVLPLDSLGGVKRHALYRKYGYPDVYIPTRRICYYNKDWEKRPGSNFHSVIMTFNNNQNSNTTWETVCA